MEKQNVMIKECGFSINSFSLQYTSVMLIVLSILTGAYLKPEFLAQPKVQESPTRIVSETTLLPKNGDFTDLFVADGKLDLSRFSHLVYLVNNHDLVLDFTVYGESSSSENDVVSSSLARSVELFRGLRNLGIAEEAISIKSNFSITDKHAELNITKGLLD